jgi:hypothetical protein
MIRLLLVFQIVMLSGCDGQYAYKYRGRLFSEDHAAIAGLHIAAVSTPDPSPAGLIRESQVITDSNGQFSGEFFSSTGWVLYLRPPPPKLDAIYLYVEGRKASYEIHVPLDAAAQSYVVSDVRHLDLGNLTLHPNKASSN